MLIADGYATIKMTDDARGKQTGARFYGGNGEPVLSKKKGYHGWSAEYDERGNETVATDLGLNGHSTPGADGVAI